MKFVTLNLKLDVKDKLGPHYDPALRDEYTAACPVCDEQIGQDIDECPYCQTAVIWDRSPLWRRLYGNPDTAKKRLAVVPPDPDDKMGQDLMRRARMSGFANLSEAKRWRRILRHISPNRIEGIMEWAFDKAAGRGAISIVLNTADKLVRQAPVARQPQAGKNKVVT